MTGSGGKRLYGALRSPVRPTLKSGPKCPPFRLRGDGTFWPNAEWRLSDGREVEADVTGRQ